ncbi:MAG: S-layer homology domain-containing protein [Candidatus Saganbacteria bacterium]|nr:S-layer homology domain-containing protein [Candidatus Saganbacteria bacterium]
MRFVKRLLFLSLLLLFFASFCTAVFAVTLTISSPKDGMVTFDDVLMLRGNIQGAAELKVNNGIVDVAKDGSFKTALILNPGKNYVEVKATGEKGKPEVKHIRILRLITFPDVEQFIGKKGNKHWARDNVIKLATLGLVEAYPDNNFYLTRPVSRGEFATWLCRAANLPPLSLSEDVFYDVPKEHWRAPYIKAVVEEGYMNAFEGDLFWIDDGVLRGEAAEVIIKAEGAFSTGEAQMVFEDVPKTHKYAFWIGEAFKDQLVYGVSTQKRLYDPNRFMTRAESTVLFSRDKKVVKKIDVLFDFDDGFNEKSFCQINSAPIVRWVKADPATVYVDEQKIVVLTAEIVDRQGLEDIANVTVDLTGISGPPDATMFDDETNGDEKKGDGIYSLKILVKPAKTGDVQFKVKAVDRYTFEGLGKTKMMFLK